MQRKLLFLSFIEGAAVMAAELCGAKLLAPIFGSSLYVWASVLGITLTALALGYFYGGLLTERTKDQHKSLFRILVLASFFLLLMPVISYYLVPRISCISFLPAVVFSTFSLLFFPVFFLGATSPLFIILQANDTNPAGKVSGTVYAVSTLGGIAATFLCGFYFIPGWGLNLTGIVFGSLLFVSTLVVFKLFKVAQTFFFAGFVYLNLQFVLKSDTQLMVSDGIQGHLEVQDVARGGQTVRLLSVNSIIQTEMSLKDHRSVSEYIQLLDTLIGKAPEQKNALVLGLGGGLTANLLLEKNYSVTGVEFDDRIIEAGRNFFFMDCNVRTVCQDARYFLNHCSDNYDLVLFDVFKAEEQPDHVITAESLARLKKNLTDSALLFINWHGYTTGNLGKGTAVLHNTLSGAGFSVRLLSFSPDQDHRNLIFLAEKTAKKTKLPFEIRDVLPETDLVNTDDQPLLEKTNAGANKTWRSNYLRYYQNK
jgi:spermidine synthase